ncbi:6136_t:CDS:2 [Entrophospora sp. SA101]|nr:3680_t:CDS:2 [Entrophospora sp. SA101]CAJ0843998.1 6136_t:CDS:2 [Entrophospora sp. SA101]
MSFIQELVRELQADLDALCISPFSNFEASYKQIRQPEKPETTKIKTTVTPSINTTNNDKSYNNLNPVEIYNEYSEFLKKSIYSMQLEEGTIPSLKKIQQQLDMLILFIAKITIVVYAIVVEHLLMATLPLLDDIYYWEELEGSRLWTFYHLIQTIPIRTYFFSNAIYKYIITRNKPNLHNNANINTANNQSKKYFSIGHTMINMFPTYTHSRFSDPQSFSFPLAIRYEVHYKKSILRSLMKHQAKCLGFLVSELNFKFPIDSADQLGGNFKSNIAERVNNFVMLIEKVLNHLINNDDFDVENGIIPDIDFEKLKLEVKSMHTLEKENQGLDDLSSRLQSIITTHLPSYAKQCNRITSIYGRPSFLTRWWLPVTISSVIAYKNRKYIYRDNLMKLFDNSLERMVLDFARDNLQLSSEDLIVVSNKIREGDLSVVLMAYEQELKKPFKSTITGNLIRTLLIQVQKTKVDLELAMAALDKLLKSNELNFAFLAVGPSLFVVYLLCSWMERIWWNKNNWVGKLQGTNAQMRESLRQAERILVKNYNSTKLTYTAHGLLLCHVHHLRIYSSYLPSKNSLQTRFLNDLRDLDNPSFSVQQKILTCERMWRFWGFLK